MNAFDPTLKIEHHKSFLDAFGHGHSEQLWTLLSSVWTSLDTTSYKLIYQEHSEPITCE